jgi:hypothetical protein
MWEWYLVYRLETWCAILVLDTIIFVMANRRRKKSIVLFGELHYLIKRDIYMFINRQELIFNDHTETRGPQGFRPWRWIIKNARQFFFNFSENLF